MEIEIIGSIDGDQHYNKDQVASLLQEDQTKLTYGEAFMGRPGTHIFVGQTEIVKLRAELDLNPGSARKYVNHALEKEQKIQVHHPHKTWFLLKTQDDKFKIGNICPRLNPLHIQLNASPSLPLEQNLLFLKEVYRAYFYVASSFDENPAGLKLSIARWSFYLMTTMVTIASVVLMYLILTRPKRSTFLKRQPLRILLMRGRPAWYRAKIILD